MFKYIQLQEEEAAVKVEEEAKQESPRNNPTIDVTHTEEMSQEIADLMMNNVGVFARKNSRIHHVSGLDFEIATWVIFSERFMAQRFESINRG